MRTTQDGLRRQLSAVGFGNCHLPKAAGSVSVCMTISASGKLLPRSVAMYQRDPFCSLHFIFPHHSLPSCFMHCFLLNSVVVCVHCLPHATHTCK